MAVDPVQRYRDDFRRYETACRKLEDLVTTLLAGRGVPAMVEARPKSPESLQAKLLDKSYEDPLVEVTDLVGLRVVVPTLTDAVSAHDLVAAEFDVDPERSVEKGGTFDAHEFGYRADQLIVRLSSARAGLDEYAPARDLWFEIQIRTQLQDAWAKVDHYHVYKKPGMIPNPLKRRLYSIAATLELVDHDLDEFVTDAQNLVDDAEARIAASERVELTIESLNAYLEHSDEIREWQGILERVPLAQSAASNTEMAVAVLRRLGYETIEELDATLREARPRGERFWELFARNTAKMMKDKGGVLPDPDTNYRWLTVDRQGIAVVLGIAARSDRITERELEEGFGFGEAWRVYRAADQSGLGQPRKRK